MIYQIYGFNMICDNEIESLQDYSHRTCDPELPTVTVEMTDHIENDFKDPIEVPGDVAAIRFSNDICMFYFRDGGEVHIVPDTFTFCGNSFDNKRIGEELTGPGIMVLSRCHRRAVLHGSAFLYRGKAYLVLASSGSGKSTLSSAMVRYHRDISFLTDDIICVTEDGTAILNGLHCVHLNPDSADKLYPSSDSPEPSAQDSSAQEDMQLLPDDQTALFPPKLSRNLHERNSGILPNQSGNQLPIGGIFLLGEPLPDGLLQIQTPNTMQAFCDIVKHIKLRSAMTNDWMLQEMSIINKMITRNAFVARLRIEHDYQKLQEITDRLKEYIDEYTLD